MGLLVLVAILCWSRGVADARDRPPLKIAIVQVPPEAPGNLRLISSEPSPKDKALEQALIAVRMRQAQDHARAWLGAALGEHSRVVMLQNATTEALSESLDLANDDQPIPREVLHTFKQATQADAVLRFRITEYGRVPRRVTRWVWIGTGVWIGTVAALAYANPATQPFVGAYLGGEVLEEGTELIVGVSALEYL